MRLRDTRLWTLAIVLAFLLLWCVSFGVLRSLPPQEALPNPGQAVQSPQARVIGVAGWCLVGAGAFGVALAVFLSARERAKRRRARRPVRRALYGGQPVRYRKRVYRR